ncbi:hypothetical protein EDB85DRAFT_93969 [Lactarius pseudohatsudake]|nr:hypothetical protein EDB85DRAFT_93969 [Lactarius pseudohatsudake]
MSSFMRRFKQSQNLDTKDTPSLMHSPSTISSTSHQISPSIWISLRQRMTAFTSMLHFRRGRGCPSSRAFPTCSARHRLHLQISVLPAASGDVLVSSPSWTRPAPIRLSHLTYLPAHVRDVPKRTNIHRPTQRTVLLPDAPHPRPHTQLTHIPALPDRVFEPRTPRLARQQARQSLPIPLSFVLAHIPRSRLPVLTRLSKRFSAVAQLALYRTLELSADDADACVARLAGALHLTALVTTLTLHAYPPAHGPSFVLALALALRSMRALSALTLPAFDAELLSAAPGTLTHLTLLADTLPYAFFDGFLPCPRVRVSPT